MDIGADDVAGADALKSVVAVIAVPAHDATERDRAGAEVGPAAVVLEARDLERRTITEVSLDRDVADQAWPVLADGLKIDQPQALDPLVAQLVAVAKQLIAATHGEQDCAVADGRG